MEGRKEGNYNLYSHVRLIGGKILMTNLRHKTRQASTKCSPGMYSTDVAGVPKHGIEQ